MKIESTRTFFLKALRNRPFQTNMDSSERRRDARARISLPCAIVRRGGDEKAKTLDASYRGLCLQTSDAIPLRQLIKLHIDLPGREEPLETHGVVTRAAKDALGRWEIGLRFFALNGQDQVDWESFVAARIYQRRQAA